MSALKVIKVREHSWRVDHEGRIIGYIHYGGGDHQKWITAEEAGIIAYHMRRSLGYN